MIKLTHTHTHYIIFYINVNKLLFLVVYRQILISFIDLTAQCWQLGHFSLCNNGKGMVLNFGP